ncbi:MAG: ribonuclease HII [Clostridia bacterium]|nr:ribonuclease HII [Clostridia bacterium]
MNFERENSLKSEYSRICGVDEAGRGPLAGPVVAAGVILPTDFDLQQINDSKKLSPKKREILFDRITANAIDYAIEFVDEKTIDEINILQATLLAMKRVVLKLKADFVLIDGNQKIDLNIVQETVIKGDSKVASIACASILAKVARDRFMVEQSKLYPEYEFERHKGYPTKLHREKILEFGACDIHRKSFLTKILKNGV